MSGAPDTAPGADETPMPAGLSAGALHGEAARAAAAAQGAEGFATVADALAAAGHPRRPVWLSASARTAQEAADVLGIALGQIAKSIVFRRKADEAVVLVVTSGDRRVDERKVAALTGPLGRADAAFVKAKTGFSIGGVSPVAHATAAVVLIDRELFRFDEVWAAAGHPHGVFPATPQQLAALTGAPVHDVVQGVAPDVAPDASTGGTATPGACA